MDALAADPSTNDTTQTSEELLAKYAATRCERTFRKLHDRHWEEVCNFVTGLLGNHHDAEDVAQEVFIRVHQRLDTYDPGRPVWPCDRNREQSGI